MKLTELSICNFMSISEATIQLADRGLVLIQGDNRDDTSANSNGAGKSSISDALLWVLYGVTSRGESGDAVINDKAGKGCKVSVSLSDDGMDYVITRHRKHKTGKNSVTLYCATSVSASGPFTSMSLTKGTDKLTEIEIEKVVGSSLDVFRSSVIAGQDELPDLPGMTDRNLKAIVEEAAGITVLERAYIEARERSGKVKVVFTAAITARDAAMERIKDQEETIETTRASIDAWDATRADRLLTAKDNFDIAQKDLKETTDALRLHRSESDILADITATRASMAAVLDEVKAERQFTEDLSRAEQRKAVLKGRLDTLKVAFDAEKGALAKVDHQIGCPCDSCGRDLTAAELAPTKASITLRARMIKEQFEATRTIAQDAVNACKTLADTLASHRASMTDTSATSAKLSALSDEKAALDAAKRAAKIAQERAEAKLIAINTIEAEKNPFITQLAKQEFELQNRKERLHDAERDLEGATKTLAIAEHVTKVFSPAGVRGAILEEVTPYLNDQTARYLGVLSDGNIGATWSTLTMSAKGEAREKFAIEVEHAKGGKSFGLLSGGEKRKVRIAAALALQDLVATRASKKIELMMLDEIDNALDAAGLERLMAILDEKAKERGSVFVISHNSLKDWIPNVLTVIKEGEVSRIEEEAA